MGQNSRANKSNSEGNKSQSQLTKIEGKKHNKQGIPIRGKRKTIGLMEVLCNTPPQPSLLCFSPNPLFTFFSPCLLSFNLVYLSIFCLIYINLPINFCITFLGHTVTSKDISITTIYISSWSYIYRATYLSG